MFGLGGSEGGLGGGGAPGAAVEGAVVDGFADVAREDFFGAVEVGYGAGYFEDAVVGSSRHVEALHGIADAGYAFAVEADVLFDEG